jgi:hypothetical protein
MKWKLLVLNCISFAIITYLMAPTHYEFAIRSFFYFAGALSVTFQIKESLA